MKNILSNYLYMIILLSSSISIFGQQERTRIIPEDHPQILDFSKSAFIDTSDLDPLILSFMQNYHVPGLAALIIKKDYGIYWYRNYGYKNVGLNQPVDDSTLFILSSVSKTIVATAIMQFWEADSFDLDDNINDYLNDFQVNIPYHYSDTITFRMLLNHTSGIDDNWDVVNALTVCGDCSVPLDTFLINYFTPGGIYYNTVFNFTGEAPGVEYHYSNIGTCVLAYLVEVISGMSFDQYCSENIFIPLEMNKASWFLEDLDTATIATPYNWDGNQYVPICHYGFPDYPAGQLRTTILELSHFLSAYMHWGDYNGISILDSSTVDLILSDHLGYPIFGGSQGLIWWEEALLHPLPWGHTGGGPGSNTGMFYIKNGEWGVICLMNSRPGNALFNILNILFDSVTDVEEINAPISTFYLEQNYPNPFNPLTKIKFSIPQASDVVIKVFDVLGNEIETLVNEEKPAGIYELIWYAENLPSGVYFYQLLAGDFIQTKKMVLMK